MDKPDCWPWMTSRACRVMGGLLITTMVILVPYYDTSSLLYRGQSVMSGIFSTVDQKNRYATWRDSPIPSSCSCTPDQPLESPLHSSHVGAGLDNDKGFPPNFMATISLEEAFFERMRNIDVSQTPEKLTREEVQVFKSRFLPNNNYMSFPLLTMKNVCIDPTGALLLINTTLEELNANISGPAFIPELYYLWNEIYTCNGNVSSDNCAGVSFAPSVPTNHTLIRGTTAHMLPYIGNSMHNWAERTWPFIMAVSPPLKFTVPYPIDNYIIHRFDKWLFESKYVNDRAQLLWQFRMATEISGSRNPTYLRVNNQSEPACFEHLILQQHARERIDETRLPVEIAGPAVRKYRDAIFAFFGMPEPQVRLPPKRLRVLFYGRNDTSRRRVANQIEVIAYLRHFSRPPLEVYVLDEMLASGATNYTFSEVIRIFSQTDILVIAHGANTWATFLLPEGAGVVELFGPCNWSAYNHTDLRVMHTWMHVNAAASKLKHDISNPFQEAIANPSRGNTTMCKDPYWGIPDYTVDIHRIGKIINSFAYPNRPGDPLTQHWLHDWNITDN